MFSFVKHIVLWSEPQWWPFNDETAQCTRVPPIRLMQGSISHTSAATFHSAFTSVIGWRTDMDKVWYVPHKVEWNSVGTDIVSTKYNVWQYFQMVKVWFYLHYSHIGFVYTKLRLHLQQIIRVITTLLFAECSHVSQIWNRFKVILS